MNKIGLILAQNNEIKYLSDCLQNWISWREHNPLVIAVLDVCFQENSGGNSTDGSIQLLKQYKHDNKIDFFEILPPGLKEHEARNVALKYLLDAGVEIVWLLGSDEIYSYEEINNAIKYVKKEEFITWFRIEFKNLVFDDKHYIKGFNPGRIFRTNQNKLKIKEMYYDDDFLYTDGINNIDYKNLSHKQIPIHLCNPLHYTWLDDDRSKKKWEYQIKRWGKNGCSFFYENEKIVFNKEFYKKNNISLPEIYSILD